ncbi:hypothetical protein G7Y89_g15523 [Cudoniella acicularis]|uniref:Uncharacterized protein n=1 Tax=Cudoniella acicularis TaxID=354080 RepID=A0A8H4QLG2_9HELO|nr:hypothetical protein G7Y89_g15523 [Cudoniella acicularis]
MHLSLLILSTLALTVSVNASIGRPSVYATNVSKKFHGPITKDLTFEYQYYCQRYLSEFALEEYINARHELCKPAWEDLEKMDQMEIRHDPRFEAAMQQVKSDFEKLKVLDTGKGKGKDMNNFEGLASPMTNPRRKRTLRWFG